MARKGSPKVRSGCRTCKSRKVKCDEFRPACQRCSSTGRTCGGYDIDDREQDQGGQSPQNSISLYRPRQLKARDEQEGRSFNFFAHVVSPVLSGPMDTYFWTHLVMQFSHFTPAVRHASIAVSSLYEDFLGGSRIFRQKNNVLALKHYNAAIQEVRANPARDEQLILMVCIIFVCIELLQGNPEAATRHCKHGIAILEKFHYDSERTPSDWVVRYLLPIFRRLSLNLMLPLGPLSGQKLLTKPAFPPPPPSIFLLEEAFGSNCISDQFNTLVEVSNSFDQLQVKCASMSHAKDDETLKNRMYEKEQLRDNLQLWSSRVSEFELSGTSLTIAEQLALCNVRMKYEKEIISLDVKTGPKSFAEELTYDQHLGSFRTIVSWAQHAAELSASLHNAQRQSFSFEMGFLPPLHFVVMKCRDFDTRIEALSWMPHLTAAKESLLDLGTLYRVSRRVIEIEHNISLDDNLRPSDDEMARRQLTPMDPRVAAAPVDHEMEVLTAEDGTVFYRRTALMIIQYPDGTSSFEREILKERKLRQFDLEIPGMRSV